MLRIPAFAIALLASSPLLAQTTAYDPKIAYVLPSGKTQYLYLANGDGSHAVRTVAGVGNISGVDFAPGGGRIAFSDGAGLKVVSYSASNAGVQVAGTQLLVSRTVAGGIPGPPDFSSDGTRLIFQFSSNTLPNALQVVDAATAANLMDYPCRFCSSPRFLRTELGNAFAFLTMNYSGPTPLPEIWSAAINADGSISSGVVLSTTTQAFKGIDEFDAARTRNSLVFPANFPTAIRLLEFDLMTGAITDRGLAGRRIHYTADDSHIDSLSPHQAKGDYIDSLDLGSGYVTHLTARADYGVTDTRP